MTTYAYNTRIRHDSDAVFREWANEIHTALTTIGCTQTADTGQINFGTVTRAGTNADAGYAIYYMNDSMHASQPIYFKLYFGTGGATSAMRLRLEVGTGSDGAGAITGGTSIRTVSTSSTTALTADTVAQSFAAFAKGGLFLMGKYGRLSTGHAMYGFAILRTCSNTGAASASGFLVLYHNNSTSSAGLVPSQAYSAAGGWRSVLTAYPAFYFPAPYTSSATDTSANLQVVIPVYGFDMVRPLANAVLGMSGDFTFAGTFSATTVGASATTFLCIRRALGGLVFDSGGVSTNAELMPVYE